MHSGLDCTRYRPPLRPFPHSSQGVHTYREHAEIYSRNSYASSARYGDKLRDKCRPEESSRSPPPSGTGGFWEGYKWKCYRYARLINELLSYYTC